MLKKQSHDEYHTCDPIEKYAPYIVGFSFIGLLGWGGYLCCHLDFSKKSPEDIDHAGEINPDAWMMM